MKKYSTADRKQALRLHKKGWGYNRISQIIGCYPSVIKKWIEAAGQEKHPGPKYPLKKRKQIIDWYQSNEVTIIETSKRFGVDHRTLGRWLREDGIKARVPRARIDRERVIDDLAAGMKRKDIAKKYNRSESWVYRVQSDG